jgi:hypothetical protein
MAHLFLVRARFWHNMQHPSQSINKSRHIDHFEASKRASTKEKRLLWAQNTHPSVCRLLEGRIFAKLRHMKKHCGPKKGSISGHRVLSFSSPLGCDNLPWDLPV